MQTRSVRPALHLWMHWRIKTLKQMLSGKSTPVGLVITPYGRTIVYSFPLQNTLQYISRVINMTE